MAKPLIQTSGKIKEFTAYTWPDSDGSADQVLTTNGDGALSFASATTGDITGVAAGILLDGGGTGGDVTLNVDLTEAGEAAIANGDYILFLDGGATGTHAKEAVHDLATLFAGAGLTATNSVIAVDAAQSNVTSLGTLTALTVDDVAIDGKVITMTGSTSDTAVFTVGTNGTLSIVTTDNAAAAANIQITADGTVDIDSAGVLTLDSGAAINLEPASGSAILLDGTISVDAGVVTGATSITSTAFVGTLSTAAQTNVTSLGTLTALTVDDVNVNGKVITMTGSTSDTATFTVGTHGTLDITTTDDNAAAANITITADGTFEAIGSTITLDSGGAINLEPASGSAVLIDGTLSIDAGVVTGATSITSTAFVGDITGDVTGNADTSTKIASITNSDIVQLTASQTLTNKTLTAPALGTPASGTLTNCSGLPAANISQGTMASGMVLVAPVLGTIASGDLSAGTGTAADFTSGNVTVTANNDTDETVYPVFVDGATGSQGAETDTGLTYNPSSGLLTTAAVTTTANLIVGGNLTVSGTTTTVNTETLTVEDPLIALASGNTAADAVDIGIYGLYDTSGSQDLYSGLFRDASDSGKWKLFKDLQAAPTTTVDTGAGSYAAGTLVANLEGTVTTAAQTSITSLGTLTSLAVDNIGINGNTIEASSGAITLTAATGSAVAVEGVSFDGGVVTGASSITSTAFVGTLSTAAQTNVTSLGTLTALTVDDVNVNGKVITMTGSANDTATMTVGTNGTLDITTVDTAAAAANITITADGTFEAVGSTITLDSGGAINLEPHAGSAILLDGTISIDAGVVTGATSITSTAFVGALNAGDGDITNVGDISLDSISTDSTGFQLDLSNTSTGNSSIKMADNVASGLKIKTGNSDTYMDFVTTNSAEKILVDRPHTMNLSMDTALERGNWTKGFVTNSGSNSVVTDVVYIAQWDSDPGAPMVSRASNTDSSAAYGFLGVLTELSSDDDGSTADGCVQTRGFAVVKCTDDGDSSAIQPGTPMYLGTNGKVTKTAPTSSSAYVVRVGHCIKQYTTDGSGTAAAMLIHLAVGEAIDLA